MLPAAATYEMQQGGTTDDEPPTPRPDAAEPAAEPAAPAAPARFRLRRTGERSAEAFSGDAAKPRHVRRKLALDADEECDKDKLKIQLRALPPARKRACGQRRSHAAHRPAAFLRFRRWIIHESEERRGKAVRDGHESGDTL